MAPVRLPVYRHHRQTLLYFHFVPHEFFDIKAFVVTQHVIDRLSHLVRHDGIANMLSMLVFEFLSIFTQIRIMLLTMNSYFGEGPLQVWIADFCAPGAIDLPGALYRPLDQPAITAKILNALELLDGVNLIENKQPRDFPQSRGRLENVIVAGMLIARIFKNRLLKLIDRYVMVLNKVHIRFHG